MKFEIELTDAQITEIYHDVKDKQARGLAHEMKERITNAYNDMKDKQIDVIAQKIKEQQPEIRIFDFLENDEISLNVLIYFDKTKCFQIGNTYYGIVNNWREINKNNLAVFEKKKFEDLKLKDVFAFVPKDESHKYTPQDFNYIIDFIPSHIICQCSSQTGLEQYYCYKEMYEGQDCWVLRK